MRQRHHFADKGLYSQSYGFSSSHVWMWELLDHKEGWVPRIDVFELWGWRSRLRVSLLDCKEIKPVNLKGKQLWIFIERIDTAAEAAILWPIDSNTQLNGKDPDAGKIEGKRRRGQQRMRWLDSITALWIDWMDMNLSKLQEIVKGKDCRMQSMRSQRVGHNLVTEQ